MKMATKKVYEVTVQSCGKSSILKLGECQLKAPLSTFIVFAPHVFAKSVRISLEAKGEASIHSEL